MNKPIWCGVFCVASLSILTGCSSSPVASSEVDREYDFDALSAYMPDATRPAQQVSFNSAGDTVAVESSDARKFEGFYGHWVAKIDLHEEMKKEAAKQKADSEASADPEMQKAGEEFAKAMASAFAEMMTMELDIEKDGTFKMSMMGMPMEGKWKQSAQSLCLVPEKFLGMTSEDFVKQGDKAAVDNKPLILQISPDGATLIGRDPDGVDPTVLEFKRAA